MARIDLEPVRATIQTISGELRLRFNPNHREITHSREAMRSVAVIGAAGQTGGFFTETLAQYVQVDSVLHGDIGSALSRNPEIVILATQNPTEKALNEIAQGIKVDQRPFTLVLSQNGIDVVPTAERVLGEFRSQTTIVRASLWTNVSREKTENGEQKGKINYNKKKKRISLAPVDQDEVALQKTANLFEESGFDVQIVDDYKSMEWTKLWANLWNATSSVTLLSPWRTFSNRKLFEIEHRGAKDRKAALEKAGIPLADIKWVGSLRFLTELPSWTSWIPPVRLAVAYKTAQDRNNQPSAAARELVGGKSNVESTIYYHEPIYKLAEENKLEDPADWAIADILRWHDKGDITLHSMTVGKRKALISEVFDLESRDVYIPNSRVVRLITEGWFRFMSSSRVFGKRFEVSGTENLQEAARMIEDKNKVLRQEWEERKEKGEIKEGEEAEQSSMLVDPNHRAHPDHIALALAIRKVLGERFPLIIVAGMLFENEILSRTLGNAYDRLLVWTVKNDKDPGEMVRANIINRRSDKAREQLMETSRVWVTYLEGGRSKPKKGEKPQLQKPIKGTSLWLKNLHFGAIVSAINRGTERMLPPGRNFPGFASVFTRFGQIRTPAYFREEGAKERSFAQRDGYVSNLAMKDIAEMLPADERGEYSIISV